MPDPKTEVGIILAYDSPVIEVSSGSGKVSRGKLYAGTLVIADKLSLSADWVSICGNDVLTKWKPQGKIIFFAGPENYKLACEEMLQRLSNIEEGVGKLLRRPVPLTKEQLKLLFFEGFKLTRQEIDPPYGGRSTGNTISVVLGTAAGALTGGYLFPQKRIWEEKIITPGVAVQTDNGTIQYGPSTIRVERREEKKFNPTAAIIGGVVGGVLTYVVNKVVF